MISDKTMIQLLDAKKQKSNEDEIDLLFEMIKNVKKNAEKEKEFKINKEYDKQDLILHYLEKLNNNNANINDQTQCWTNDSSKLKKTSFWIEMANQIGIFLSVVTGFIVAHSCNYAIQSTIERYQIDKDDPFLAWVYALIMFFVAIFIMTGWGYLASRQIYLNVNPSARGAHAK